MMTQIYSKLKLEDANIMEKILSEQDRIIWESMGLTPDVQSMENAALLTKVQTFCFLKTLSDCLYSFIYIFSYSLNISDANDRFWINTNTNA